MDGVPFSCKPESWGFRAKSSSERDQRQAESLSIQDVADIIGYDLADRGLDLERLDDPQLRPAFAAAHPDATPVGALRSVFDALA